ncbi:MAG: hypothetical protein ACYTDY_15745 [Planctomycetota bacterium]|jgi:hypothetical protein
MRRGSRVLLVASLVLLVVVVPGCDWESFLNFLDLGLGVLLLDVQQQVQVMKGGETVNRYFALSHPGGHSLASGWTAPKRDIWVPFRVEATAGHYDSQSDFGGAGGSLVFGVEQHDLAQTFEMTVMPDPGAPGLLVQAGGGAQSFPGAARVHLALVHDGTKISGFARSEGATEFLLVGEEVVGAATTSFCNWIGAHDFYGGDKGGFDNWVVLQNGEPLSYPTPEKQLAEDVWACFDPLADSFHRVDRGDPDTNQALALLEHSVEESGKVVLAAKALRKDPGELGKKPAKTAFRKLKAAWKKGRSAKRKLAKGKKPKGILKRMEKSLERNLLAVDALDPRD